MTHIKMHSLDSFEFIHKTIQRNICSFYKQISFRIIKPENFDNFKCNLIVKSFGLRLECFWSLTSKCPIAPGFGKLIGNQEKMHKLNWWMVWVHRGVWVCLQLQKCMETHNLEGHGSLIFWKWNYKFPDLGENDVQGVHKNVLMKGVVF